MFQIKDGRKVFYQFDLNAKLIVSIECKEVHFTNDGTNAKVVIPYDLDGERVVNVPNILLQDTKTITAYAYIEDADGGYTKLQKPFIVIPRAKPEDYVYTETEVLNYTYLDNRLQELEGDGLANAVADYLAENPVQAGATAEEAAQIAQNEANIETLSQEKLSTTELNAAIDSALAQAKASGEFDGEKGDPGKDGQDGADYVLTEADKTEIAEMAASLVDTSLLDIIGTGVIA